MCDKCETNIDNADHEELLLLSLGIIGGVVEGFVEEGYCDPALYKAVKLAERISIKIGRPDVAEKFAFLKIQSGEIVEMIIEREGMDIKREEWS